MSGKDPDRNQSSPALVGVALAVVLLAAAAPARADDMWDTVLQKLNLKATPADPPPAFVEKTRPNPNGLSYMPPAVPHKVSPLPVKTADQIQAQKDALDAAQARQTNPGAPAPLQAGRARKAGKAKPPAAVAN